MELVKKWRVLSLANWRMNKKLDEQLRSLMKSRVKTKPWRTSLLLEKEEVALPTTINDTQTVSSLNVLTTSTINPWILRRERFNRRMNESAHPINDHSFYHIGRYKWIRCNEKPSSRPCLNLLKARLRKVNYILLNYLLKHEGYFIYFQEYNFYVSAIKGCRSIVYM